MRLDAPWAMMENSLLKPPLIKHTLITMRDPCPPEVTEFHWQKWAPLRAQLTLWFLAKGKLETSNFLTNINLIPIESSLCPWCSSLKESKAHLFFICPFARKVWCAMLDWWGIRAILHEDCITNISSWSSLVKGKFKISLWESILLVVV